MSTARALGLFPVTATYLATPESDELPSGVESSLAKALEPLGIPATALRFEKPYTPPIPARWNVMMTLAGAMVLIVTLLAVSASAQELRPQLRLLRVIGFGGPTQRVVSATQAAVITALSLACGLVSGFVLAGAQLWPKNTAVVVSWDTLGVAVCAVIGTACAVGFLIRPVTVSRAREGARGRSTS
ncbi:hypothetical protein GCM10010193_33040 [Kitasatospora atroaurantiaca]|uniref:ABC3 transporter permease C-terminal domain-containing protein n=1 Tax=Kitasatospora atroaurantiaca TaxID=285545 RepID=A0A561ERN9_9ACTN|nr:hypothetical protein [Kitasatospora atroaurantiaca]TWE18281.1 hypothetical protein FB465_3341 [Kitasatospora atroaurantiaca]